MDVNVYYVFAVSFQVLFSADLKMHQEKLTTVNGAKQKVVITYTIYWLYMYVIYCHVIYESQAPTL